MDNEELKQAIEAAWSLVNRTSSTSPVYEPSVALFKALCIEQEKRARAGDQ